MARHRSHSIEFKRQLAPRSRDGVNVGRPDGCGPGMSEFGWASFAIGALCCEMGFDWKICRGLGVMARAVGLVGHILEESRRPMAEEIWHSVEAQATAHFRGESSSD